MIAKTNRFTRRQFEAARKRMKSFRSGPFLFLYREMPDLPNRFAVVVKKKTDKRAVVRNRFKRQAYNALKLQVLPKVKGLQLISIHQGKNFEESGITVAFKDFMSHYNKKNV